MHLLELEEYKKTAELYLRALWGRGFVVNGLTASDAYATPLSFLANGSLYVPQRVLVSSAHKRYYRAAVAHAALHVISDSEVFDRSGLNYMQRTVVGLVEDLRLEVHAIKQFPGLKQLWLEFHDMADAKQNSALYLMLRLSRCILDPKYKDEHQWVQKGKQMMLESVCPSNDSETVLGVGLSLANDLGQMRLPINSGKYEQPVAYRDDNRCLWKQIQEYRHASDVSLQQNDFDTQNSRFVENNRGIVLRLAATTHSKEVGGFELLQDTGDDFEYQKSPLPEFYSSRTYPEWDYKTQVLKQDWCRIVEYTSDSGELSVIDEIASRYKHTLNRLRGMAHRLRVARQQWQRKVEDGDDYDLMCMVDAIVATRTDKPPDTRVFIRKAHYHEKNLAISILLDLSESTNELVDGGRQSISQVLRDAVFLLAETLSVVGDRFSVTGFSSDGRHQVNYIRFKTFVEDYGSSKQRLSTITGKYSTRLGAAIRHSASDLAQQPEIKKLLLVITDGAPSDVDVYDKSYLVQDSWHAVRGLRQHGIKPFCINLDRNADNVIEHIFGQGRTETLGDVTHLPDLLAHLYMRYMHT